MIGSTTPVAEQPDWHPVHRANAMLRAAMLSSAHSTPSPGDFQSIESLSRAVDSVMQGPVSISFPKPLASRLDALGLEDAFPSFEALMEEMRQGEALPDGAQDGVGYDSADESDGDFGEPDVLTAGVPLDPERRIAVPQLHVQTLMEEFRRRQRQASMLVAGSIVTAVVLTVGGIWLVAHLAAPLQGDSDNRPLLHSTSVAWQKPADRAQAGVPGTSVLANRAAKSEPLLVPAVTKAATPQAQMILAASGRQIAFASLLPPSHAGYYLIRGLPRNAKLSAGRQSDSGTWLVKAQHAHALTLSLGAVAEGDYPVEVYVLQSGDSPQARRSLVLRVETPAQIHADKGWTSALLDLVPAAQAAEAPAIPADLGALHAKARRLLAEGDIAAARLLLIYLAERGEGEAAYELGRTFDQEMLAQLGAKGIAGDIARARGWYERAVQSGSARAAERLKILASHSGPGPSD